MVGRRARNRPISGGSVVNPVVKSTGGAVVERYETLREERERALGRNEAPGTF